MRSLSIALVAALVLGVAAATAAAAAPADSSSTLDRIAAVVNDDVVLASDVEEQLYLFLMRSQARPDSAEVDTLRRQILEQLIDEKLLVAEARRSGIVVPEAELARLVDQALAETRQRLGSEQAFREQLARESMTEERLRERYREEIRRQQMAQRLVSKNAPRARVTPAEAEAYFKANPGKFPKLPPEFRLAVIQIPVRADSAADGAARVAAAAARKRILAGERFAKVAQEISDDPGSARSGGDLGFFTRGSMDAAFERAAFTLAPGVVSEPVRTPFGWHLIEVVERDTLQAAGGRDSLDAQGRPIEEAHARHILIKVDLTQADAERAEAEARRVWERARKGEDFAGLVKRYSRYEGPASESGELGWISLGTLQPAIRAGLEPLKPGEISEPLANPAGYNIFKVLETRPERAYTLEEVRGELPEVVGQLKQRDRYEAWLQGLRSRASIRIAED